MPSEFVVPEDAAPLVAHRARHVRERYGVDVALDAAAPIEGSRWVRLSGADSGREQQAKDYIVALCSTSSVGAATSSADHHDDGASNGTPPSSAAPAAGDEAYNRMCLDYARKLGYSESQIRDAICRLGGAPPHNALLEELLKHGAAAPTAAPAADGPAGALKARGATGAPSSTDDEALERRSLALVARGGGETAPAAEPAAPFDPDDSSNLRHIVIDGSNVAMSHGNKEVFSCRGIELAVNWFLQRGHKEVTVLVPNWRREQTRADAPITDQPILRELEKRRVLVFTPSRRVQGRRVVCYDDRFIVRLAHESDGVVVSNDNYRDLQSEKPEWRRCIEERLLMYSFVNDKFMLPDDPLGRDGPTLENFLRKVPVPTQNKRMPCPYGRKCTFGNKCKYSHPERSNQIQLSLADELRAAAVQQHQAGAVGQQPQQQQPQQQPQQQSQQQEGAAEGTGRGAVAAAAGTGSPSRGNARLHRKETAPAPTGADGKQQPKPYPSNLQPQQIQLAVPQHQLVHGYHHQQQHQHQQQQTRIVNPPALGVWGVATDWSDAGEECSQHDSGYNSLRTPSQDGAAPIIGGGGYVASCYSDSGIAEQPAQYRQTQYYPHDAYAAVSTTQSPSKLPPHLPHPPRPSHPPQQHHHHQQHQQHHQHPHHGGHTATYNPAAAGDGQLLAPFPVDCCSYRSDIPYSAPCSCCVRYPAQKQQPQQPQQPQQHLLQVPQVAPRSFSSDGFLYDGGPRGPLPQPNSWHGPLAQPSPPYHSLYQHSSQPPAHHHQPYHHHQQQQQHQQQRYQPLHYPPIAPPAQVQNAASAGGAGGNGAGGDDGGVEQLRAQVFRNLCGVFPQPVVERVMSLYPHVTDSQELATHCVKIKALPTVQLPRPY